MAETSDNESWISTIRQKAWRQGSVVKAGVELSAVPGLKSAELKKDVTHWVLLSHDCDIHHHDFTNEPNVELVGAQIVTAPDGTVAYGKNPRRLQIRIHEQWVEFHAGSRTFIERRHLVDLTPDPMLTLSLENVQSLSTWTARRYIRTAFPDSFNNRLQAQGKNINKLMSREGSAICTLYVLLSDEIELPDGEVYRIDVVAAMRDEDYNHPEKRVAVETTLGKLCGLLNSCAGIKTEKSEVRAERDISLTDVRFLRRLEFDYMSLNESDAPPSPRP